MDFVLLKQKKQKSDLNAVKQYFLLSRITKDNWKQWHFGGRKLKYRLKRKKKLLYLLTSKWLLESIKCPSKYKLWVKVKILNLPILFSLNLPAATRWQCDCTIAIIKAVCAAFWEVRIRREINFKWMKYRSSFAVFKAKICDSYNTYSVSATVDRAFLC